ncbi:MAG: NAD(+) diphosphatase [Steroidobacteraceae bacterium]
MAPDNLFAGAYLDRRADARLRADWLAEARSDAGTLYVAMHRGAALVHTGPSGAIPRVVFLSGSDPRIAAAADPEQLVLLGWYLERRCVLVDMPADLATPDTGEQFAELRPLVSELPAAEASLMAYARAMNLWRASHLFCGRCGTPTQAHRAGHARHCPACNLHTFPRLDPAIIVLAHDGARALLGRQPSWPAGRYSTIAGFVEPGESLEDAVRRELHEETGVVAGSITYHSSQPWPFPASLMLGFTAEATLSTPVLHDGELEDARWFTREELLSGAVLLPPPSAIARRLIDGWLQHAS